MLSCSTEHYDKAEYVKTKMRKQYHPATGIPRSHMIKVSKDSKGAMLTSDGKYVVLVMDK